MNTARLSRLTAAMFCAALILSASRGFSAGPVSVTPANVIERAAAAYSAGVHGVTGMQRHFTTVITGGPIHHSETSDSGLLLNDGAFVRIRYYRIIRDGKSFSPKQIAERDGQTNRDWAAGKVFFKEPYDRRFMGDYNFTEGPACTDCPKGTAVVDFSSARHDAQHGSGSVRIQTSSGRVERLTYTPYALPPHATSGSVTESNAEVLPGLSYVTRISETFRGRYFLIHGNGVFTGTQDHFRRFQSIRLGETALADGTI